MALKTVVAALTDVHETLRSEYELRDGAYHLKLDGAPAGFIAAKEHNETVGGYRDNNIKLLKALGADSIDVALSRASLLNGLDPAKLERLKAIDPDEYAALKAKAAKLKDKGLDDPDTAAATLKTMLDAALKPVTEKLEASEKARTEAQARADAALLRETVGSQFTKAGGKPTAMDFIVAEFQKDFRVVDNAVKAHDGRFSAEKVGQPLSTEEWLTSATKRYDFAFELSKGGGAVPAGGAGAPRPGVKQIVNPTPQELGQLQHVPGKGLVDKAGQPVEIVSQAS